MTEYRVVWEIDLDAESPEEAVRKARAYQLFADTKANAFDVFKRNGKTKSADMEHVSQIDLLEIVETEKG